MLSVDLYLRYAECMLSFVYCYAECHNAKCRHAEYRYAEFHGAFHNTYEWAKKAILLNYTRLKKLLIDS